MLDNTAKRKIINMSKIYRKCQKYAAVQAATEKRKDCYWCLGCKPFIRIEMSLISPFSFLQVLTGLRFQHFSAFSLSRPMGLKVKAGCAAFFTPSTQSAEAVRHGLFLNFLKCFSWLWPQFLLQLSLVSQSLTTNTAASIAGILFLQMLPNLPYISNVYCFYFS